MSCGLTHTGIFATSEETEEIRGLHHKAQQTPVVAFSVAQGLAGKDMSSLAWKRASDRLQGVAIVHGLPDFEGYYGLTKEGEFIK